MDTPTTPYDAVEDLPKGIKEYLSHPSLYPLWTAARTRLERSSLTVSGTVTVNLDAEAAHLLKGLYGASRKAPKPGRARVDLGTLDAVLRSSAAQAGLMSVVVAVTGAPLVDRKAKRARQEQARTDLWSCLDAALARAGLADAAWAPGFVDGVRRSGLLTKAGPDAPRIVAEAGAVLDMLATSGALKPHKDDSGGSGQLVVELAELATRTTGDAHGLDEGRTTPLLVLRASAAALGFPTPATPRNRRDMWSALGVAPDSVSGTVLTWGLRPPSDSPWAGAMCLRADAGIVTHLTLQELRAVGALPDGDSAPGDRELVVRPGTTVWACENPQVVQAAARAGLDVPFVCTSGTPSVVGWQLLSTLANQAVDVRYHGDFDWPGVGIAASLYRLGVRPWRMSATDYEDAVHANARPGRVLLSEASRDTPWDSRLATVMRRHGVAIHEEELLDILLHDVTTG